MAVCRGGTFALRHTRCRAGAARVDRGHDSRQLRWRAAGRDGRSAKPVARRRADDGDRRPGRLSLPGARAGPIRDSRQPLRGLRPSACPTSGWSWARCSRSMSRWRPAGVAETVQVSAESPLIDVKQNAAGANIQAEIIERIPRARNFTGLVTSAPGVTDESRNRGIQIDGASGADNRFMIDGVDTTDLRFGTSGKPLANDFVQEVQVKSSGYNAEYRARHRRRHQRGHQVRRQPVPRQRAASTTATRTCSARCGRPCAWCRATRRKPNTSSSRWTTSPTPSRSSISADRSSAIGSGSTPATTRTGRRRRARSDSCRTSRPGPFESKPIDQNFNFNVTGSGAARPARPVLDHHAAEQGVGRAAGHQHRRHQQQHAVAVSDDQPDRQLQRLVRRRRRLGREQQDLRQLHDDVSHLRFEGRRHVQRQAAARVQRRQRL